MRLGNSPCSWGVEFASDPRNPPWSQVLDECAAAGFDGIELGPVGFLPEDPVKLRSELDARNLTLAGAVVFQPFHYESQWEKVADANLRTCRSLVAHGASQLVLIDSIAPGRTRTLGRPDLAPTMTAGEWTSFVGRVRLACEMAKDHGLRASIHGHAGGYVDFEPEIDRLLNDIPDDLLGVCLDTAHLTLAGGDPLSFTRRYVDRLAHVHLKDIDPLKRRQVVDEGIEFYAACAADLFCEMGHGAIDFAAVHALLTEIGYDGWCVVEQDCAADATVSKVEMARANRQHLETVGFRHFASAE